MVEVCGIEPQSKNNKPTASTCLAEMKISLSHAHFPKHLTKLRLNLGSKLVKFRTYTIENYPQKLLDSIKVLQGSTELTQL